MEYSKYLEIKHIPDWPIIDQELFWSGLEWHIYARLFNNFDLIFRKKQILWKCKDYIDHNAPGKPLSLQQALDFCETTYSKENYTWNEAGWKELILLSVSFSEYYSVFPLETDQIMKYINHQPHIHTQVGENNGNISCICEDFRNKFYEAYAYMRTQPQTFNSMIID